MRISVRNLIAVATFPGVVVHEMAHLAFCRLLGIKVYRVCYFRFGVPAGYVIHDRPANGLQHILVGAGPFIINSAAGAAVSYNAASSLIFDHVVNRWDILFIWLGFAIASHAFPSSGDARNIWRGLWRGRSSLLAKLIGTPIVAAIYIGGIASLFWLDLLYGAALVFAAPILIRRFLAI